MWGAIAALNSPNPRLRSLFHKRQLTISHKLLRSPTKVLPTQPYPSTSRFAGIKQVLHLQTISGVHE
ncbi:hypothetical protein LC605_19650 [Nostoc sp. CHAB 5836]|uniref:hypothetical protein n=1 Tax=Nostoc sp. CHAB 5836 TaxID=2780404 RepID=UPI001E5F3749|nr:hypothetical protein [Nostoc sp. CHAB 5836]MCC5617258.1 hypothetical protein [Nostoc sp. CHAB 5836]